MKLDTKEQVPVVILVIDEDVDVEFVSQAAIDAMPNGRYPLYARPVAAQPDAEQWVDENVSGNPVLIKAMKNFLK